MLEDAAVEVDGGELGIPLRLSCILHCQLGLGRLLLNDEATPEDPVEVFEAVAWKMQCLEGMSEGQLGVDVEAWSLHDLRVLDRDAVVAFVHDSVPCWKVLPGDSRQGPNSREKCLWRQVRLSQESLFQNLCF